MNGNLYVLLLQKNLHLMNPPKLKEIVVWIAQLGGFLNRKSDNNPGVKTIWIGVQRMRDFALLWETVNSKNYTCV